MLEVAAKVLVVFGLMFDLVAVLIGGRAWLYSLAAGVRAGFAWNSRLLQNRNKKYRAKLDALRARMVERPSFFRMFRLQSHLSGMRTSSWQSDAYNAKQRVQWQLPPRSLLDSDGLLDAEQLLINGQEIDDALQNRVVTGTPRDFSGLAFKLFLAGFVLTLIGTVMQ